MEKWKNMSETCRFFHDTRRFFEICLNYPELAGPFLSSCSKNRIRRFFYTSENPPPPVDIQQKREELSELFNIHEKV